MEIKLLFVSKTKDFWVHQGVEHYRNRLRHYAKVTLLEVKGAKALAPVAGKTQESERILAKMDEGCFWVLLDERGKQTTSVGLSQSFQKWMNQGHSQFGFIVGGAYGVDERVAARANWVWSISQLTFPHQLIRLSLVEQLYRAMTLLKGEKYHHP